MLLKFFTQLCKIVTINSDYSENCFRRLFMSQSSVTSQSTWRSKIKAMGPGILMASAAVGGSHIVSSTQAGGKYGWALLGLVILANLFKYPFFRFGAEYTADTGKTLVEGYAEKGKFYL
jgi:Mn2+/Fe2+ NRAMP family transporter